jgi:hypothetical protein
MKQHQYRKNGLIWFGKPLFSLVMRLTGKHWYLIHKDWLLYTHALGQHIFGINEQGERFVYCPKTLLTSWSPKDYDERWCHACQEFIEINLVREAA